MAEYFYEGYCNLWRREVDQKLSKAIKHPYPTYEKECGYKMWYYFYWDRERGFMKCICRDTGFPKDWEP